MKNRTETALAKFSESFNCAQSVLYAFSEELHLDPNVALKLACGFGAGMGRKEEVCGAATGGIMLIGAKFGRDEQSGPSVTEITYEKTRQLIERFEIKHGTYICRKLLYGCDLQKEEGQRQFREQRLKERVCAACVQNVMEILEELLCDSFSSRPQYTENIQTKEDL